MSETEFHGSSSVAAASTTTTTTPLLPHYHSQHQQHQFLSHGSVTVNPQPQPQHQQHQQSLSLAQRMQGDTCFRCHQQGHWAIYCPFKTPPSKSEPSTSTPSPTRALDLPLLRCRCGRYCLIRVAQTDKNPGRKFYTCPGVNVRTSYTIIYFDNFFDLGTFGFRFLLMFFLFVTFLTGY